MNRLRLTLLSALTALLFTASCDTYEPASVGQQYVVEAYLAAGRGLPPVRLSRTAPVGGAYDFAERAVSGAEVQVQRVDGERTPAVEYREEPDRTGIYRPVPRTDREQEAAVVKPLARYRLTVRPPDGDGIDVDTVTAETVVPDTFRVVETSGGVLTWREDELSVTVTHSRYPGRGARFVITTTALEPTRENLTPLAAQLLSQSDEDDLQLEDLSVTESPVINEGNYEVRSDGTLTIDVPWLVVNFYGPNEIVLRALGNNYYDFLRSQSVQQGGSTFSPGEIPNVIERVSGGTGLFGSYAAGRYEVEVRRPGADASSRRRRPGR